MNARLIDDRLEMEVTCPGCRRVMLAIADFDGSAECPDCRTVWTHYGSTITESKDKPERNIRGCAGCRHEESWRYTDSAPCAACIAFDGWQADDKPVMASIDMTRPEVKSIGVGKNFTPDIEYMEADPSGKAANEPGAKLDAGKVRPSLILSDMPRALMAVAEVATFGARKYSAGGWQHVENGVERYTDAMDRHRLYGHIEGPVDSQSGLLHAAHEAWNSLARLELMLREAEGGAA